MAGFLLVTNPSFRLMSSAWLPFVPGLDGLSRDWRLLVLRRATVKLGMWVLLSGLSPRLGGAMVGGPLLFQMLIHRSSYCTASTLEALLGLQLAVAPRASLGDRLCCQYALVYGGAALNKLRMADWRDGRTMSYFLTRLAGCRAVARVAWTLRRLGVRRSRSRARVLFSAIAILTEFAIAFLYLARFRKCAAALSLVFHIGTVAVSRGGVAWVYVYHALTQAAFFLPAPRRGRKPGGGLFWLVAGLVVAGAQAVLRRRYGRFYAATPTLDRAKPSLPATS